MNSLAINSPPSPAPKSNCPICRDDLHGTNKPVAIALPCYHRFHAECIHRWNAEHLTCPLGRRVITRLQLEVPLPRDWQMQMVNAARRGELEQVKALLLRGAHVDAERTSGQTPFAQAARNKHIALAELLASQGATDPWGQFYVAEIYLTGTVVPKDMHRAQSWYLQAANQNLSEAQSALGYMYFYGYGVPKCKEQGFDWLKKAAAQNNTKAQGLLGCLYFDSDASTRDIPQALDLLHKAAEKGMPLAQCKLGALYWQGLHVTMDLSRAHNLLQQAANCQLAAAQVTLALFYLKSEDAAQATQMRPRAIALLQQAADRSNNIDAMLILAQIFWDEQKDTRKAVEMLSRAAGFGDARACLRLAHIYNSGCQGVEKNVGMTMHYYQKAAKKDCYKAHYQLGIKYQSDEQVRDFAKARHHFEKAAEQGLPDAQFKLGDMYWQGQGTPMDLVKAQEWFGKAAQQGHQQAKESMAKCREQSIRNAQCGIKLPVSDEQSAKPLEPPRKRSRPIHHSVSLTP